MNALTTLRHRAGFETQQQLADKANVAMDTISRIERGATTSPSGRTLWRLAAALEMEPADLAAALAATSVAS